MSDSIIHRLSPQLAQKIAAGEVVTRPESVVKELLENAIDAKSETITIVLKNAGKALIQIIDDGVGMSREDAQISIERYATSKLKKLDDLDELLTFGFRGEALAAIASVSQFELRTRRRTDELGTLVEVEGGIRRKCESIACDEGTSISIRNLFFNIPARRKFMKSEATEFKHIVDTVTKAALAHPDIRFIFVSDSDCVFDLPAFRPLPERIEQIFGSRLRGALIPVEQVSSTMHVFGFVSAPSFVKRVRTEQFYFVNGRPVQSRSLSYAVQSSYEHLVEKGAFPSAFLFVELPPSKVDVNVHPQKLEVKFEDERGIAEELRRAIQAALQRATQANIADGSMAPRMTLPENLNEGEMARLRYPEYGEANPPLPEGITPEASVTTDLETEGIRADEAPPGTTSNGSIPDGFGRNGGQRHISERAQLEQSTNTLERLFGAKAPDLFRGNTIAASAGLGGAAVNRDGGKLSIPPGASQPERSALANEVLRDKPVLWQLHNKYIFSQIKSGLMIVDQHVAHERILYERVLRSIEENAPYSQQLLFPQTIDLVPREMALVKELMPELTRLGFQIRFFGGVSIVVEGIPGDVRAGREESILREVLEAYEEFGETKLLAGREALAASFACKAAIKAGDKLQQEEMHVLIEQLFQTQVPWVCPHGRPIVIKLAIDELDRRFGRSPVENFAKTHAMDTEPSEQS